MKTVANISLYEPGIVLFDPSQLADYLNQFQLDIKDVFDFFINNEEIGKKAVATGVIFPIYEIPEREYSIFTNNPTHTLTQGATKVCHHSNLPIEITSGILITADLNALIDWDEIFFTNYIENYKNRLDNNDYLQIKPGRYSMDISGYTNLPKPLSSYGYELKLTPRDELPTFGNHKDVSDFNFSLD
ncbi:hypothetical protein NTD80_22610 [Pseudomonas sp. 13B_2.1_Bac1]|uniref:hypothetical protein n=1 Tax=Pseudomonas sp. 13B_2.1_Bac1 TaxID=2971624 RepID=UPI0021CA03B9|nr:hypothetical protein [Pseudomonas sp. 13B_2.1_Bac1]MCU1785545.1 hypothetical protein [Pseudomonas sp. 13B_2.1_Bac1]